MNVLSLFDGIAGARLALDRTGIPVDNYFASEVDKWAIKIAQKNYPDIVQLGDVRDISAADLPKIDLLIGGSPCQGFSYAGKQLNFDDPRSALFFEYVRLLREVEPTWFLLENVRMKQEWQDVISGHLGVKPILINSALVSAQNRERLYWTNIPDIRQPEDRGLVLADIIEHGVVDRAKSYALDANYYKGNNLRGYFEKRRRQLVFWHTDRDKAYALSATYRYGCDPEQYFDRRKRQLLFDREITKDNWKSEGFYYRKLTLIECERLQTYPDSWTEGISNTQRYKALGNSFTVDVIAHILRCIPN